VALQYFQRTIELTRILALCYAGLADAYAEQADADLAPEKAFALSKHAALRALSINPDLAEPRLLGHALFYMRMEMGRCGARIQARAGAQAHIRGSPSLLLSFTSRWRDATTKRLRSPNSYCDWIRFRRT